MATSPPISGYITKFINLIYTQAVPYNVNKRPSLQCLHHVTKPIYYFLKLNELIKMKIMCILFI